MFNFANYIPILPSEMELSGPENKDERFLVLSVLF